DRDTETARAAIKEFAAPWRAPASAMARRTHRQAPSAPRCSPLALRIRTSPAQRQKRKRRRAKTPRRLLTSWTNLVQSTPQKGVARKLKATLISTRYF